MKSIFSIILLLAVTTVHTQAIQWKNVDTQFGPLPRGVHVYFTDERIDSGKFRAYYTAVPLTDKNLQFTTDTTLKRRFTPSRFYEENGKPLIVVNGTFFSFETNQNLNLVMREGKLLSYNVHSLPGRGKDTLTYRHPFPSAIGISRKRKADVAWIATDSLLPNAYALQEPVRPVKDSFAQAYGFRLAHYADPSLPTYPVKLPSQSKRRLKKAMRPWKMDAAIGGGPVLVQDGDIRITNNEELKFAGKAIGDKHPRTAMGYTADGKLIILVVEGRNPDASGATLVQLAQLLKDLGCVEALNLDGGGSSCLLINGKETIKPSDKEGQRPVPAVFMVKNR